MQKVCLLITLLFIGLPVYADSQAMASALGNGGMSQMVLLVAFIGIFYFLILRPQSKRVKAQQQLINNLQKGDEVLTTGGLVGRIESLSEQFIYVNLADQVSIWVQKQAIAHALPKGTLQSLK